MRSVRVSASSDLGLEELVSIFEMIRSVIEGTMQPGPTLYDLSVDGGGYSTSGGFVDDIADQLDAFKAQIVSGEITVPTDRSSPFRNGCGPSYPSYMMGKWGR